MRHAYLPAHVLNESPGQSGGRCPRPQADAATHRFARTRFRRPCHRVPSPSAARQRQHVSTIRSRAASS
jgi:hypothetical protein